MYDWLADALRDDSAHVVTRNRRLARTLVEHYGRLQLASGRLAWRRPAIYSWKEWLAVLCDLLWRSDELPLRINAQQSLLLWEQCLERSIDDPLIGIASLAGLCRDTWLRLHEWCVPLSDCQAQAIGADQRIFARAAGRYADALSERHWIDDALLPDRLTGIARSTRFEPPKRIVLAGFDRISPQEHALLAALVAAGATQSIIESGAGGTASLRRYDNPDAELRAAGAWARAHLTRNPDLTVAVVVSNLEKDAERCGRLLAEGLEPGWQCSSGQPAAVNLSYGRRLADYPAIHTALLALRWLYDDLRGAEISQLLRSPFIGKRTAFGRSRLELKLREWPDRNWAQSLLLEALSGIDEQADAGDWLTRLRQASETVRGAKDRRRPSQWAEAFAEVLRALNWPGEGTLASADFQLDNRWRQLLNEFARLELVSETMRGSEAVAKLSRMAGTTVFQAETAAAAVSVLGPLEAAGHEFDRLWVCGLAAADWPPASRPLALMSRELQRDHGMPDSVPEDTAAYAARIVRRLAGSARSVVFSYPEVIGDAQQTPSALLADMEPECGDSGPGWYAASLAGSMAIVDCPDRVPRACEDELIGGGAATINHQLRDPFSAFALGRLGIRRLPDFSPGIAAAIRGRLVHEALHRLYRGRPTRGDIRGWSDNEENRRVEEAVRAAVRRRERFADAVLKQLLAIERRRSEALLRAVMATDRGRPDFAIDSVELSTEARVGGIRLTLRCDRIDRLPDGGLVILDYKTGRGRKFMVGGRPGDMQLVVYACGVDEPVAGLALFNVDSRQVCVDGAGPALTPFDDWALALDGWKQAVVESARQIAAGDVRLNVRQSSREGRPLALLSRYAELRHES